MANKTQKLRVALWYRQLLATNNEAFMPLFFDEHRYLVLKGGGGSGKSIFAGRKILERCATEKGHRILVCRKVGRTLRQSCWKQLLGQIREHYQSRVKSVNRTDMVITFKNGSEILFSGLDDVEKLKSIYKITGIWIEEASEILEHDFDQLDIRLRGRTGYYKQIILTFNPVSLLHWLKKRFFDAVDPRALTHESTYKDNRFLDEESIVTLERFRELDEYFYTVYCLGMWGVTGRSVFDAKAVSARLREAPAPVSVGYFSYRDDGLRLTDIRWVEDPAAGCIKVYAPPEKGVPYVLGGDTAGDGSDSFVGQLLDNRTGAQAAVLRHVLDEDLYAKQMYCLGRYYNDALIGIETNYSTYPVMELQRLRYPRQYVRETADTYTGKLRQSFGFRTDTKTRPVIIAELIRVVRDDIRLVTDETTLQEMLTFVRGEHFRPEAEAGSHDDTVMALAIAHHIRPQQSCLAEGPELRRGKWTEDMWEDYRGADRETRQELLSMWGTPG